MNRAITEAIEKYETLTPRERTIAVGELVLGWRFATEATDEEARRDIGALIFRAPNRWIEQVAEDWADSGDGMLAVIEKMQTDGWAFEVECDYTEDGEYVHIARFYKGSVGGEVADYLLPRAVGHAALRAIAAQEDK